MTKIKICGITMEHEIATLNEMQVDYAGFVFYEKSKRNISMERAKALRQQLLPGIKSVAVTVTPDASQIAQIVAAGFDILQIHGDYGEDVPNFFAQLSIPIWRAVNISDAVQAGQVLAAINRQPGSDKITGYVVDGNEYGGGKTFDWEKKSAEMKASILRFGKQFILAGGLTTENVTRGITIFSPDIVDVSSGVEGASGKSPDKIKAFVRKVKEHGEESK